MGAFSTDPTPPAIDAKGNRVKKGDKVLVLCEVVAVHPYLRIGDNITVIPTNADGQGAFPPAFSCDSTRVVKSFTPWQSCQDPATTTPEDGK
jgi:hypothetical protein